MDNVSWQMFSDGTTSEVETVAMQVNDALEERDGKGFFRRLFGLN